MEKKIDALFENWQQGLCPGGQVLVIHKGKVLFEKCYGYANLETRTPMTPDSVFHVASVTKPFTSMCTMILHERGLLNVYDDVRKYIPDMIQFPEPLTLKQMLNHVSGLRGYYELMYLNGRLHEDHYAQHEVRKLIGRQKVLNFKPGSEFLYTNANYMLLATIIERVSGMTFNEFATENIFEPLGMEKSFIRDDPHRIIPNKVNSYHDDGYEFTNAILTFGIYGGTSLHTTCRDLAIFMNQYKAPTLISRETLEIVAFDFPEVNGKKSDFGAGIRIAHLEGHKYYHHGGVNAGYRTIGQIYPEDDLIITAFSNTYNIPIEDAARDIARIVLGLPARVPKNLNAYEKDTVCLENVDGTYYCDADGSSCHIRVREDKVYMDGIYMTPVRGNLFKQGRRNIWLALGGAVVARQGGDKIVELRRLTQQPEQTYMERCVGEYYCDDAQSHFEIACEDGRLWVKHLRFRPQQLHWLGEDSFFYDKYKIRFVRDEQDRVTGYLFSSPHLRKVEFTKVK